MGIPGKGSPFVAQDEISGYLGALKREMDRAYDIARKARRRGLDPSLEVEIPFAEDMAGRVESLVGPPGVSELIRDLMEKFPVRERLSIEVARRVARNIYKESGEKEKALEQAVRTGLAILTEGVLVAPLEGIVRVVISRNEDGTTYPDIYFSGPIRAAGGTAQAMSVLLGDIVGRELSLGRYHPTEQEINRYIEEFQLYRNLQYRPSNQEIRFIITNCPVCINGEGTEKVEVQGYRDLPRVPTNRVRSGVCLVIAEGLLQKASKLLKITGELGLKDWEFLKELKKGKEEEGGVGGDGDDAYEEEIFDFQVESGEEVVQGETKYISDLIMGRPVFSHPSRPGGFRLRYGRARTAGLASIAIHPATMAVVENFLAVGTQLKTEFPGKAGVVTPCESIDGPSVLLKNGDFIRIKSLEEAEKLRESIERIVDLGDILIPVGEFLENNHPLMPGAYTEDWWEWEVREALYLKEKKLRVEESPYRRILHIREIKRELERKEREKLMKELGEPRNEDERKRFEEKLEARVKEALKKFYKELLEELKGLDTSLERITVPPVNSFEDALRLSKELGVPLHPNYTLLWHDLTTEQIMYLREHLMEKSRLVGKELHIVKDSTVKEILLILGAFHREREGTLILGDLAGALYLPLGLSPDGEKLISQRGAPRGWKRTAPIALVSYLAGVSIRERAPTRIGGRMGRPEKASMRKMKPPVHGLFPVGTEGGPQRLVQNAAEKGRVYVNPNRRVCPKCGSTEIYLRCRQCNTLTRPVRKVSNSRRENNTPLNVKEEFERALRSLGLKAEEIPKVKGVRGLTSSERMPERLEKGILRSLNEVYVFKDGTSRYDMTDIPLTHFRPKEIGTDVDTLKRLGYTHDVFGKELESDEQILELKPQDLIINRDGGRYLTNVARFLDDMLVKMYNLKPFYRAQGPEDLIGHLVLGLAPHTSAGVLGRIIGYTDAQGCLAHPFFHASKRRNCDGDEDAVMLLLDALINFSRSFLPESRGGKMDAPLVISAVIRPEEIDKEAHNIDVSWKYPLDFYLLTTLSPSLESLQDYLHHRMDTVKSRLGSPKMYSSFGFTHDTSNITAAPLSSAYKVLGNMEEKMAIQFDLEKKLRAVDEKDVAERILSTHLIPDVMGNIRSFGTQTFRCTKCQKVYRRLPLTGRCTNRIAGKVCNNPLILTVHEGNIKKYMNIMKELSFNYDVSSYTRERVEIHMHTLESLFKHSVKKKENGRKAPAPLKSLEAFL